MLIVWYVIMVMGNVSWIYAGLVLYAWRQHCAKLSPSTKLSVTRLSSHQYFSDLWIFPRTSFSFQTLFNRIVSGINVVGAFCLR